MTALSSKDKLKLKVSSAKVERWERERQRPAKNFVVTATGHVKPVERCRVKFAHGREKESPVYESKDTILSDDAPMRSSSGKIAREYRPREWHDYCHDGVSDLPRERGRVVPVFAKPRKDSPFKRAGARIAQGDVVIIRK